MIPRRRSRFPRGEQSLRARVYPGNCARPDFDYLLLPRFTSRRDDLGNIGVIRFSPRITTVPTGLSSREQCWIFASVLVSFEAILSLTVSHSDRLTAFGDITQCLLLLFALFVALANVRAGTDPRSRLFWALLGLGCGIWLCVQILWTYFEVFLRTDAPNPFVGDVALFLHLVPMMGALAVRPDRERDESIAQLGGLDFGLLITWWLYLYLFVVIPWQYVWPHKELYGRSFDLLYFIEHLVFVACAARVWLRSTGAWKVIYGHLFGAGLLYALSSVTASVAIDLGRYYTGSFYDIPLLISMLWFSAVGLIGHRFASQARALKANEGKRRGWISALAMVAILSLPVLAGWALYMSSAPARVRNFRVLLTLATMVVMGTLLWIKQHGLDTEIARSNQKLREDSYTDLLTGSKNRRYLTATIESDVRRVVQAYSSATDPSGKRNPDLVFYLIDCDYFKEVNDLFGHEVGDQLLVELARDISSAIRHSDVLIRWGGDEFLVVSRYTNREEANILAERVLQAVGSAPRTLKGEHRLRCTCSIGWAVFPWFVHEPEAVAYTEVLRLADCALYEAKKAGRNQAIGMLPTHELPLPSAEKTTAGKETMFTEQLAPHALTTLGPQPHEPASGGRLVTVKAAAAAQQA
jgi:diguanylate cyclase (GGDEF)-like protein